MRSDITLRARNDVTVGDVTDVADVIGSMLHQTYVHKDVPPPTTAPRLPLNWIKSRSLERAQKLEPGFLFLNYFPEQLKLLHRAFAAQMNVKTRQV